MYYRLSLKKNFVKHYNKLINKHYQAHAFLMNL